MHELMASATRPMPKSQRELQLSRMYQGLAAIERGEHPTPQDWRMCSDAVNLLETMIEKMGICEDPDGLIAEASRSMGEAAERSYSGGAIRLDGQGIFAVRSVLEDYAHMVETLPARTMIRAHRLTEERLRELLSRRHQLPPTTKLIDL